MKFFDYIKKLKSDKNKKDFYKDLPINFDANIDDKFIPIYPGFSQPEGGTMRGAE
jgi:hypothetical protein